MCLLQFVRYKISTLYRELSSTCEHSCMCFIQLTAAVTEFDAIFLSDIGLYFDEKLNWPAVVC